MGGRPVSFLQKCLCSGRPTFLYQDHWNDGKTYEIQNLEEWLTIPIGTLVQANKMGTLSSEFGGHISYLKAQAEKRARMEQEIAEYNTTNVKEGKAKK